MFLTSRCMPKLRVYLCQKMHVIRHYLQFDDISLELLGFSANKILKPFLDDIRNHRTPAFRAPNSVAFAGIYHIVIGLDRFFLAHLAVMQQGSVYCNEKINSTPYIPMPESRGFTASFR